MNLDLNKLQPYPFQKLAKLFGEVTPNAALRPISMHIGEPKHATPSFIKNALIEGLNGLSNYPTTQGSDALRMAISNWPLARLIMVDDIFLIGVQMPRINKKPMARLSRELIPKTV